MIVRFDIWRRNGRLNKCRAGGEWAVVRVGEVWRSEGLFFGRAVRSGRDSRICFAREAITAGTSGKRTRLSNPNRRRGFPFNNFGLFPWDVFRGGKNAPCSLSW